MPTLLLISGFDPTGCAGFLLDSRIASHFDARPIGSITVLTEQSSDGLRRAEPVSAEIVGDQLRALLSEQEVDAVKIGALGSLEIAERVADALALTRAPVVLDPVAAASAGGSLLRGSLCDAVSLLAGDLALITPNRDEAAQLLDRAVAEDADMTEVATALRRRLDADVLLTGGHFFAKDGGAGNTITDAPCTASGVETLSSSRIDGGHSVRGTGCALSTAIASRLAHGEPLLRAVTEARAFLHTRLQHPTQFGRDLYAVL